jgi:cation diffusion facilitator family transporter
MLEYLRGVKMTAFIIKMFINNHNDINNLKVRAAYGILSGSVGVICNIFLSILKFIAGIITHSISVTADAANNLSDAASSVVTLAGMKIANKPADEDHPFGHGRLEYVAALIVSFMIVMMGFELFKSSLSKILNPQEVIFSLPAFIAVVISIPVKLWLALFNKKLADKTGSLSFKAVMSDSLSDCIATSAVAVALLISKFSGINIDGYIGILVAGIIMKAGIDVVREIISPLLGQYPDPDLIENIEKEIMSYDGITGLHDMILHDYGPGRTIGSVHAEVPANVNLLEIHDVIDNAERKIKDMYGIVLAIHMDPVITDNEKINELKAVAEAKAKELDESFTIHDFRMVDGPTHTNLIFDLVIPHECKLPHSEITEAVTAKFKEINENYFVVMQIEHDYSR